VATLVWFFQKTRTGRALRAVSDDHEAALSVGIPLLRAWAVTWVVAGIVALVAGVAWGTRLGVQFSLSYIAYKALPVLIIGGIDSITGAIVAGLIVGAGENLAEVFIGPYVGGGIQSFFPYLLALIVLYFKPYGLFGKEIIERV
jgi:branched-chain amino acid transport system permease protein